MNLFQYTKTYGKYSFQEEPFNDVDNIIFSQLSYLPLEGVVGSFGDAPISIADANAILGEKVTKKQVSFKARLVKKIFKLLKIMSETERYKDLLLCNYQRITNHDTQFGAITIKLPDNSIYVSYEGTDTAISGWKEDACMTYQFPVPAQVLATKYLRKVAKFTKNKIRVGGHSKGGNLAVYAVASSSLLVQKKVLTVYNNDGPGFCKENTNSKRYQRMVSKIRKLVPQESVVGMLLYNGEELEIVKSGRKRIFQHDPFCWQVEGNHFKNDTLSDFSKKISEKTNNWIETLGKENCQRCVEDLFRIIDHENVIDTYQLLSVEKSVKVVKAFKTIDENSKKNLLDVLKAFI